MTPSVRQSLQQGEQLGHRYSLQVPQTVASGPAGGRLGRRAGSSVDFQDYREYQLGDDLRFIDWGVYARTDRLAVKLFREEVTPHLDLLIDGSRSMSLEGSAKAEAAARLAALLATAAENAQCTHAAWLSGDGFHRLANDAHPPSTWAGLEFDSKLNLDQSYDLLSPRLRRLGVRVLISDLLWPGLPSQTIRRLREGAAALFVVQILARDDSAPPERGSLRLVDSETGEMIEMYIDAGIERQYRDNLAHLQQSWDDGCRQYGARMSTLIAEELDDSIRRLETLQLVAPA